MKAEINRQGRLTVYPETELELYALRRWSHDYMIGENASMEIADECLSEKGKNNEKSGTAEIKKFC